MIAAGNIEDLQQRMLMGSGPKMADCSAYERFRREVLRSIAQKRGRRSKRNRAAGRDSVLARFL